ncbi:hypothetical protein RBI13_18630 [Alcaligenaceae bacterium A4P071]|nr:hypothetical protein [Alcaligenaceae bacterium A4P071]
MTMQSNAAAEQDYGFASKEAKRVRLVLVSDGARHQIQTTDGIIVEGVIDVDLTVRGHDSVLALKLGMFGVSRAAGTSDEWRHHERQRKVEAAEGP